MPNNWTGRSDRLERLPPNWRQLKALAWKTYGSVCHLCGQRGADTIDHKEAGDDHSLANLRPVHDRNPPHCHRFKSSFEGHEAQRRIRAQAKMPVEAHPGLLGM